MNINNMKTPSELIELYPECGMTPQYIGYLLMMNFVDGIKVVNGCVICKESFEKLLKFREKRNELELI